jgi:transcriptional regulator with GAF, ATPase, and Fis domain
MLALYEKARVFAQGDCPVLITGETGVGKEVFAARIHELSPRADKPFVRLNCAALPQDMVESELFGFERGAFTGALTAKPGLLESAHGGTVLLDEVGDLSLATQAKLLRALDSGEVTRLGALRPRRLDVRVLAATNRDLHFMIPAGTFRADLYYRLAGAEVRLPPLRERPDDIEPLAACFLHACAPRDVRQSLPRCAAARLSPGARALLLAHSWPGNVRELKATIERARMLAEGGEVREEHISFLAPPASATSTLPLAIPALHSSIPPQPAPAIDFYSERRDREKSEILAALSACDGNQTRAAEMLQMPRRTLVKRLTEYGIRVPRRARPSLLPG